MTWVRLDDAILDNPKIIRAGPIGFALHVAAITWCARNLTDGFIPEAKAQQVLGHTWDEEQEDGRVQVWSLNASCGMSGIEAPDAIEKVIAHLVTCGLWVRAQDARGNFGYFIHDYLEYNPSKAEAEALRVARQAAGRTGGINSRQALAQANAKQVLKQNRSKLAAKPKLARARTPASDLRSPVPVPVPLGRDQTREARDPAPIIPEAASETRMLTARERPEVKAFESSFEQVPVGVESWEGHEPEHEARASAGGLDLAEEAEKFRLYHRSSGKRSCDWHAEFSRWLLKAIQIRRQDSERAAKGLSANRGNGRTPPDPEERRRIRNNLLEEVKWGSYGRTLRQRAELAERAEGPALADLLDELEQGKHKRLAVKTTVSPSETENRSQGPPGPRKTQAEINVLLAKVGKP